MPPPVVLLHGFATSARRTWQEPGWIDLIAEAGRMVHAPDLLGHGQADKPHQLEAYARVEELVLESFPAQLVDAIGYSAGARVLLCLASRYPDRFHRLVIAGLGAGLFRPRDGQPIVDAIEGRTAAHDPVANRFKELAHSDGNDPAALVAFLRRVQPALSASDLSRIHSHTLVILGDLDFSGPGEPLAQAIPHAHLVTLPGVDHFGLPKAFPFLEKALDFIDAAPC